VVSDRREGRDRLHRPAAQQRHVDDGRPLDRADVVDLAVARTGHVASVPDPRLRRERQC